MSPRLRDQLSELVASSPPGAPSVHRLEGVTPGLIAVTHDVPRLHSSDEGEVAHERDVMLVHVEHGKAALAHHEHTVNLNHDGALTIVGSELLQPIAFPPTINGQTTTVPQGGVLAQVPMNPRLIDGCRLASMLEQYDQFQLEDIVFEYIQATNLTQSGQLCMAYIADPDDTITTQTGFQAVRNAYARPGAAIFSVRENARAHFSHPLLKWYYTGSLASSQFDIPGFVIVTNMIDVSNSTANSIPLGTLVMHYRVRVRSPAVHTVSAPSFMANAASLAMTAATITAGSPVTINAGSAGLPPALYHQDVVYWGTIVAADDGGGSNDWRTWRTPTDPATITVGPGNLIFWRVTVNGQVYFFKTFAAAADAGLVGSFADGSPYVATVTPSAATRGFKLWNINGARTGNV